MDASTISKLCKYFIARIDKVHKIFAPETDMQQQKSQNRTTKAPGPLKIREHIYPIY
jgi:hypothetical protein